MQLQRFSAMVIAGVLLAAPASLAASSGSISSYHMVVKGKVKFFNERVAQTFEVKGTATIGSSEIGDVDGDGLPDVATEIVSMNLTGTTTAGLAINLNSSKSNRSIGRVNLNSSKSNAFRSIPENSLLRLPANSFFDVFTELSMRTPTSPRSPTRSSFFDITYRNVDPIHIEGIAKNLSDVSGTYTQRKSISIIIMDREGNPAGTLTLLAINLNSSKSN